MADCYGPDATFQDIAFMLSGRKPIHAMWHMISETDLRATFTVIHADDRSGTVELVDDYTFRDTGLIAEHRDACNAMKWGIQALGPVKGLLSYLVPAIRRAKAKKKLQLFIEAHREYA